jgi:metallo-beta-lactamase family protein
MGMFQGTQKEILWNFTPLEFTPSSLVGMILTHAHLDHCGRLPLLVKNGFRAPIFMTKATKDLTELSLYDTAKVARGNYTEPLFSEGDVTKAIDLMQTADYHQQFSVGDFKITFRDAGHLLGSASLEIIDTSASGEMKKIVFSGDLGNSPQLIIRPTELIDDADIVVMESTYGDKTHPEENPSDVLASEINEVEKTGGTLLIPAFALERSQDILLLIRDLIKNHKVSSRTPFFLDSPMAIKATEIYKQYKDLYNQETLSKYGSLDPFTFMGLEVIEDHKLSMKIKKIPGAKVIIAGSGMMTGGRILNHAKEFLPRKDTRLLLVGYQGEETLGREIRDGASHVQIDSHTIKINANINETEALSSHADQPRLLNWLAHIKGVKKVFLTHGEQYPREVLKEHIELDVRIKDVALPVMNEEVEL